MDRNVCWMALNRPLKRVALRKESVDRNYIIKITGITPTAVALRKESVDRNPGSADRNKCILLSLSARRAWIEISTQCKL